MWSFDMSKLLEVDFFLLFEADCDLLPLSKDSEVFLSKDIITMLISLNKI